jgi:hypothetical protein
MADTHVISFGKVLQGAGCDKDHTSMHQLVPCLWRAREFFRRLAIQIGKTKMTSFKIALMSVGVILCGAVISGPTVAQKLNVDVNQTANQASSFLQNLGIQPSGSIKETNDYWCIFNNWQDRDNYAHAHGTYDNGRFSTGTMFGGRWYCSVRL